MGDQVDRVAWITGASGGIGSAIAVSLAKVGIKAAICYHKEKERAEQVVLACKQAGSDAASFSLDVTDEQDIQRVYQSIHFSLGKPHILIHAAGHTEVGLFQDASLEQYDRLMNVHVKGAFLQTRTGLPFLLQEKWGRVILLSSIWGATGGATEVLYSTAKSALHGLAKALAKEVALSGITVNVVAPGATDTPLLRRQLSVEERCDLAELIPVGRLGTPDEVASAVVFLCQQESAYITGQVIHVNGGWH
jgi:3-oxoacyl-[acyl-carrier protein] reductase